MNPKTRSNTNSTRERVDSATCSSMFCLFSCGAATAYSLGREPQGKQAKRSTSRGAATANGIELVLRSPLRGFVSLGRKYLGLTPQAICGRRSAAEKAEHQNWRELVFLVVAGCCLIGCAKQPKNLTPPPIDPVAASKAALEMFDTDGSGVIDKTELSQSPGLMAAVKTTDLDDDGGLSAEEIEKRLKIFVESGTTIRNFAVRLVHNGSEPHGLEVKAIPEPFLAEYIEPASDETNRAGVASPAIDFTDPEIAAQGYAGLRLGMYRLEVTQPDTSKKPVPKKYNEKTTMGFEVGLDHHAPMPVMKLSY